MKEKKISGLFRFIFALCGAALGGGLAALVLRAVPVFFPDFSLEPTLSIAVCAGLALLFALLFRVLAGPFMRLTRRIAWAVEERLSGYTAMQIGGGASGLVLGVVIAARVAVLLTPGLPGLMVTGIGACLALLLGYLCAHIGAKWGRDMPTRFFFRQGESIIRREDKSPESKILDTSVIIDGRIFDVCKTGFVEGPLVIPQFVLAELRHIADSGDALRRNRGRRGLDVIQRIQKELEIDVILTDQDFEDTDEVDVKLLKLARATGGAVVTNDFNLNKVAGVTGVKVLNLNDLAGALRPVLLPGEEMVVQVLREGKEHGQGVGYLDDGTMIVVDNGKRCIGNTVEVVVTTVLQTSAGRMIFARLKQAA